jgi:hypothetical protein
VVYRKVPGQQERSGAEDHRELSRGPYHADPGPRERPGDQAGLYGGPSYILQDAGRAFDPTKGSRHRAESVAYGGGHEEVEYWLFGRADGLAGAEWILFMVSPTE